MLLLLTLGMIHREEEPEFVEMTTFDVSEPPAPAAEEQAQQQSAAASPQQATPTPVQPLPAPAFELPPSALPRPTPQPVPQPQPSPAPTPAPSPSPSIGVVIRQGSNYGPADTGPRGGADSAVVGTAPDGSPLYAARWYREPTDQELSGYLSTASSTGWGLIACRTAPGWRVEDCRIIDEWPQGSGIARATQAAAWQFQVRPPRVGGTYQTGTWVRIRIDYTRTMR